MEELAERPSLGVDAAFDEFVASRSTHLLRLALLLTGWNEAVAMLNCSVGTVKSQGARGLSRLRAVVGVSQEPVEAGTTGHHAAGQYAARPDVTVRGGRSDASGAGEST